MENNIIDNYCARDGSVISKATSKKLTIKDKEQNKCMICGNENNLKNNYCILCGNILHYITTKDKSIQKSKDILKKDSSNSIQNIKKSCAKSSINLKNLNYINIFLNPIIVIGLTIMCSVIFKQILLAAIESEFLYEEYIIFKSLLDNISFILVLNLSPIKLYGSAWSMGDISGSINLGLSGICILPLFIIIITNLILSKRKSSNNQNTLLTSISSAFIYSCILLFIATISNKSVTIEGITIGLEYSFGGLFLKSFILYLIPSLAINIIKYCKNEINYLNIFNNCISVILIQLFICMSIMFIAIDSQLSSSDSFISIVMVFILIIIPCMIPIIGIAGFIPTNINGYNISLFKLKEISEYMEYGYVLTEFKYITFAMILMSIVLLISLFFVGRILKSKYKENTLKPILIFSSIYSIVMGALIYMSKITLTGDVSMLGIYNNGNVYIGSNFTAAIIVGFVYSFVVSLIGYKSKKI